MNPELIRSARENPRLKQLKQQRDAGTLSATGYQVACTAVFRSLERGDAAAIDPPASKPTTSHSVVVDIDTAAAAATEQDPFDFEGLPPELQRLHAVNSEASRKVRSHPCRATWLDVTQ
jgi:hypothetical protein